MLLWRRQSETDAMSSWTLAIATPTHRVEQRAVDIEEARSTEVKALMQQLQGELSDL